MILAAIAKSDGTRKSVNGRRSRASRPRRPVDPGKEFGIDPTGDVTVKDMSFNLMKDNNEPFLKPWPLGS